MARVTWISRYNMNPFAVIMLRYLGFSHAMAATALIGRWAA